MSYKELFDIINDPTAEIDDAIMYLANYPKDDVIEFLINISKRNFEDYILSSVGESIGQIFSENDVVYKKYREKITELPDIILQEISAFVE